jgi:predicted RecB family nuclease
LLSKITKDVLAARQHCRLKAYFRLRGEEGTRSDFELLVLKAREEHRAKSIAKLRQQYTEGDLGVDIVLSRSLLRKGTTFIFGARLDDDQYAIRLDGVKRVDGPSNLGEFHYQPVLFSEARRVRESDRQLLASFAVLISRIQGTMPEGGVIYLGRGCSVTNVRFVAARRAAEDVIRDMERMRRADVSPKLVLNDHCRICEFRERCHSHAISEDNLSLLRGLGEKRIKKYGRRGILTLTQLAHTFRPRRRGKRSDRPFRLRDHALHALAIRDKTIYVLGKPQVPTAPIRIYLDIESNPEDGFVYLIGLVVCDGDRVECHSFWADNKRQENMIFQQFLGVITRYEQARVFCYGTYEKTFIVRMGRNTRRKKHVEFILSRLTNVLGIIFPHFYFPTYSNGLKDVAGCLGCHWTEPDASSIQSIVWRLRWETAKDNCWKEKLIQYNLEDCRALRRVTEFLIHASSADSGSQTGALRVRSVTEIDRLSRTVTWGKYVQEDFEFINKRAYFDYQSSRVFVRSSLTLRRQQRRNTGVQRRWKNREVRPTHRVEITALVCPICRSRNLVTIPARHRPQGLQTRRKRAFDIIATPGAVKRKVIECRAVPYRCSQCGHCFVSERYHRLARHFHSFMSWSVYHQITHRLGAGPLTALFHETLGIQVNLPDIFAFRHLLARYYRRTYNALLARIIAGSVIHVDETEVKLHDGTGYVWVFANLESAVYIFRRSREGKFLRTFLKGFKGVVVSDFYSAYDGLDCLQQRCLIHLMRDLNRAILDNPFDQEVQFITTSFGTLLRSIVMTIDEHGLKRRHLERHTRAVASFLKIVTDQQFESDASKALQERLLKNQDRLFTFLHHDGVSWNNNVAENAIKRIAAYREDVGRNIKEAGLSEHLVLLSLYQTCRFRKISFLKFLLSRERDLDSYSPGKRFRRRASLIELYPKGYLPPAIMSLRRGKSSQMLKNAPTAPD